MDLTIVIPTRDRPQTLAHTLRAITQVLFPEELRAELLVIDSAPRNDDTRQFLMSWDHPRLELRYVREPVPGVARARNVGIREARGRVSLWTDDDVRPPTNWVTGLAVPVLEGQADVLQGGIRIASHLQRPWMNRYQRGLFASTEIFDLPAFRGEMGGVPALQWLFTSNMAVAHHVFRLVPMFEEKLGVGALGYSEDSLMAMNLRRAGIAIRDGRHVVSEHHFDPERLTRTACLAMWWNLGRSQAYMDLHSENPPAIWARWGFGGAAAPALRLYRAAFRPERNREGITGIEATLVRAAGYAEQHGLERRVGARPLKKMPR